MTWSFPGCRDVARIMSTRRDLVAEQARQPGRADPAPPVVADRDLVGSGGPSAVHPGGHPGDDAVRHRAVVRGADLDADREPPGASLQGRTQEHTSELQSLAYLVCRLLLEKK